MSKPEDIPQNVWDMAESISKAAAGIFTGTIHEEEAFRHRGVSLVARAIMANYALGWNAGVKAERQVCLDIVKDYGVWGMEPGTTLKPPVSWAVETIHAAIEQRVQGEGS